MFVLYFFLSPLIKVYHQSTDLLLFVFTLLCVRLIASFPIPIFLFLFLFSFSYSYSFSYFVSACTYGLEGSCFDFALGNNFFGQTGTRVNPWSSGNMKRLMAPLILGEYEEAYGASDLRGTWRGIWRHWSPGARSSSTSLLLVLTTSSILNAAIVAKDIDAFEAMVE